MWLRFDTIVMGIKSDCSNYSDLSICFYCLVQHNNVSKNASEIKYIIL